VEKERAGYGRALGPISENSWAFFKGIKRYDKNLEDGVARLLEELPGEPIELKLTTTTSYFDVASRIKEDWEELGKVAAEACLAKEETVDKTVCEYLRIKVTVQIQAFPDTNDFETLLIGQQVSSDPDQYGLWHSGLATNFTHYKNTKVDSLLEKGRQTVDTKERITLYQEFQQNLLEDPPAIFLWYLKSSYLARK
jgi:ABC-type transport system substrate-binding protein